MRNYRVGAGPFIGIYPANVPYEDLAGSTYHPVLPPGNSLPRVNGPDVFGSSTDPEGTLTPETGKHYGLGVVV